jgi:hypothetical protein
MPDQPPPNRQPPPIEHVELRGLARDFAAYAELERERRRNSFDDFDPDLFEDAVALVMKKLRIAPEP